MKLFQDVLNGTVGVIFCVEFGVAKTVGHTDSSRKCGRLPGTASQVRFAYEWHDDSENWYRSYGNENWEFSDDGLMASRFASINDVPILGSERKYHWVFGRRPDDHPGLSDLGL